ncbi:hypothetical protein [Amycolatopsis vancoresmycina]|uniref:hypothetical protein n=1 Tax=Amycolatopsis vancoresmycina TaxID=208444 RepID=UPI00196A1A3E|nr:hypothetical protein [Amycolatopsis vancoresmycina]
MAGAVTGEHERYARYLLEFANVSDDDEPELVRAVLTDPDRVMAESAVVRHLDLRAAALLAGHGFPAWAARMGALVLDHRFPAQRLREWVLLRAITHDEGWLASELTSASDWLQRRACAVPAALTVLAEHGRTRRVRTAARRAREGV